MFGACTFMLHKEWYDVATVLHPVAISLSSIAPGDRRRRRPWLKTSKRREWLKNRTHRVLEHTSLVYGYSRGHGLHQGPVISPATSQK